MILFVKYSDIWAHLSYIVAYCLKTGFFSFDIWTLTLIRDHTTNSLATWGSFLLKCFWFNKYRNLVGAHVE